MNTFDRITRLDAPLQRVFDFFAEPENLLRITPPFMHMRIVQGPARRLREGDVITYSLRAFGVIPIRWTAKLTTWRDNEVFADLQLGGPFRYWLHTHSFAEVKGGVEMHDHVDYELPLRLPAVLVRRQIDSAFDYRERVVRRLVCGNS